MDNEWKFEKFNDGSFKSAEDHIKRNYEQFLTEFCHHIDEQVEVLEGYGSTNLDSYFDPIKFTYECYESTNLLNLVNSDNKILNKVVVVLSTLCLEANLLFKEGTKKFIPALAFYGECTEKKTEEILYVPSMIGNFLPTLQNIMTFVNRINDVIKNFVQQLTGLYWKSSDSSILSDVGTLYFEDIYKAMSDLFYVLICLDEIFIKSGAFSDDWEAYKRILTTAKQDPEKYKLDKLKIQPFENLLMNLEGKLMQGQIFLNCCIQNFDDTENYLQISKNTEFAAILNKALKTRLLDISIKIDSANFNESNERQQFIGWCGLYGLYVTIFGNADRRLYKELEMFQNKIPALPLPGNRVWYPMNFLRNSLPYLTKSLDSKQLEQIRQRQKAYLMQEKTGSQFQKDIAQVQFRALNWIPHVIKEFRRLTDTLMKPQVRGNLLVQGYYLANRCKLLCQTVLQLHSDMGQNMTRTTSINICRGIELCKQIEAIINTNYTFITEYIGIICSAYADSISTIMETIKIQIKAHVNKAFSKRQLDVLSALSLLDSMLQGPPTKQRLIVLKIALSIIKPEDVLKEDTLANLRNSVFTIEVLANYREMMQEATDCTFIFWDRHSVFPCYFNNIFKNCESLGRLQFSLASLSDVARSLLAARHLTGKESSNNLLKSRSELLRVYEADILAMLEEHLMNPVSQAIELDLRVQFYSYILNTRVDLNPFLGSGDIVSTSKSNGPITNGGEMSTIIGGGGKQCKAVLRHCNLNNFINSRPIRFFDRHIRIRDYVERHLETVFYNLTAIYLSDWRTYAEMRKLAQLQYGLCLRVPDMHLPSQSLEQGRDLLNIMRSMAQFASLYVYNLNTQIFVEKMSDNKFLNTVNIRHVANSIRTHGLGIINTTVNNAYVFLKDKFFHFSEFLYDERIKAKLIKELHDHRDRCAESSHPFPFQNADRLRLAIRKMFVYDDGTDSLERFRNHITRMGNAMGFVRSIRSGALHCGSASANFLPTNENSGIFSNNSELFQLLAQKASLSEETIKAARNTDKVIQNISRFFIRDTDYFKMFVDVFAVEFRSSKNAHCHNFFILLPALMLSFVDHIMECKEKLNRKNKDMFIFSDDGFAIGVAFILKVLDLYKDFDSLQWFQSVNSYYETKHAELQKSLCKTSKSDENLRQTQTLSLKRLEQRKAEFKLLEYGLNSARIFFRADLTAAEEKEAERKRQEMQTEADATTWTT